MNFTLSEFNISGNAIPEDVADKILKWHITPLQRVRDVFGCAIWASQKSGYRPIKWDKAHGRDGGSQHCFIDKGATDLTCNNFRENKDALIEIILQETSYTRIAVYNTFIHLDYKNTPNHERQLFECDGKSEWVFLKNL